MNQERPGDTSNDFKDAIGGAQAPGTAPAEPSVPASGPGSGRHGFTVQPGGRNAMAGTAERIGRAAGNAQRQMQRGLELVRPAGPGGLTSPLGYASNALEQDELLAARVMQGIEDEIAEVRHEAAHRIGEFSELAVEGARQVREQLHAAVSRSRQLARRLVTEYPAQTTAAFASFCLVFGATLCLRGSRRR
jgi:hypothetical protein